MSDTDIAVVGVGCRFPDAWTPQQFWDNIDAGRVSIQDLSEEQRRAGGITDDVAAQPGFVAKGTSLPGVADFAGEFFGYPPAEADIIDPQQRIFLEVCWEALEAAGHPPRKDGPVTGVFAGSAAGTYSAAVFAAKTQAEGLAAAIDDLGLTLGGQADFLTSRVAYKLGMRGPAVSVQTACSSSLYAVHYAVLSLLSGECDIALAGGSTALEPLAGYHHQPGGLLSDDGFCRSFDAKSSGTSFSSGVGVVVLRRLADALADGDPVLAVVKGSAVGNDGADRPGYTAPSPAGVAEVVATALRVAGVSADDLRYVEAHGSGTPLGDHVELIGLSKGLRRSTHRTGFCGLGSVKTNLGHCGPAAGIAGFIKAVHIAHTGNLPPHPFFDRARDEGELAESPFYLSKTAAEDRDPHRHVLVNSMGVGGTNVAAVLAAPPAVTAPPAEPDEVVRLVLSARSRAELDAMSKRLADELDRGEHAVGDIAHTLRVGRRSFAERRVVTAAPDRLAAALRLPRPPAVQTKRGTARRAIVVGEASPELLAALPAGTQVVAETPVAPPKDAVVVGVELWEALTTAWLNGVEVRWDAVSKGRRVSLPTYPFQRKRYWLLDRLPPIASVPQPVAAQEAPKKAAVGDDVESDVTAVWRELFGVDSIGIDDEFGSLGGTSLLSVQMAFELQQRHGVLVNVHRAGGSRATVRRIAEIIRGKLAGAERGAADIDPIADGDGDLMDADIQLPLGDIAPANNGTGVLLTGATGFLGAFVLHELQKASSGQIYCLVRATDEEEAWARLREAAEKYVLPAPDPRRVTPVPGDLRKVGEVCRAHPELATNVGQVLHVAAKVVFTEPYRVLREDNVLPMVELLRWMRESGVGEFSFVSTVAATAPALGADGRVLEKRAQSLDPQQGGYGAGKWAGERLLERAEADGMRVRVFRPGFILADSRTGACNDRDLIWHILASGLAVGAHPVDDRANPMAPVDVVARAIAELSADPRAVGRAYHLIDERCHGLRQVFELLDLQTKPLPSDEWLALVGREALATGNEVLSTMALYEVEGHELGEDGMEATAWRSWLRDNDLSSAPTASVLRGGLTFLAGRNASMRAVLPEIGELMIAVLGAGVMGTGIATLAIGHGVDVTLVDIDDDKLTAARAAVKQQLRGAKIMGKMPKSGPVGELVCTTDLSDIASAEAVVEAVTELPDLKAKVLAEVSSLVAPGTLLLTNTSAIPVDELASAVERPEDVAGAHFMNPPYVIRMVEVIRGPRTSEAAMDAVRTLLSSLDRDLIVVGDGPGFVINRVLQRMINESARIVEEGLATPQDVDALFEGCLGHRTGPLATADLIGLDNVADSLRVLHERTGDQGYAPCGLLLAKVRDGEFGRKTGKGFYEHGGGVGVNITMGLHDFLVSRTKRTWEPDEDLFAAGVVSSLFALELVVYLEKAYGVEVEGEYLSIDNFRTIRRIEEMVHELQAAAP